MTEATETPVQVDDESEDSKPKPFSLPVEINGLAYNFEGEIPVMPSDVPWYVRVPNWEEQAAAIEHVLRTQEVNGALRWALSEFRHEKGAVGSVYVELLADHLHINGIATKTWAMPDEFGYQNARGVGSFMLRNATNFADIKGLPIFLEPYPDGSSPLSDQETIDWYRRYGFGWKHDIPRDERKLLPEAHGSMVRMPSPPDLTLPIAKVA